MNKNEFLSLMKSRGAQCFAPKELTNINIANTNLQNMRMAMLPAFLQDFYTNCFGITLGSACIFGPTEIERGTKYPMPSIVEINKDMSGNKKNDDEHCKRRESVRGLILYGLAENDFVR